MHAMHEVPLWVKLSATVVDADRPADRVAGLYPRTRLPGEVRRRSSASSTPSCSTNGISTSCTTALFVRPAFAIGRFFWKRGDEGTIDRFGPERLGRAGRSSAAASRRGVQIGISLHLCVRHAARPDRRRHLGDHAVMSGFPILSVMLAVPALAAVACLFRRRADRALARAGRDAGRSRARHPAVGQLRHRRARSGSSSSMASCFGALRLGARHRRLRADADHAQRVPDADLHRRVVGRDRRSACPNIWRRSC